MTIVVEPPAGATSCAARRRTTDRRLRRALDVAWAIVDVITSSSSAPDSGVAQPIVDRMLVELTGQRDHA